MGVAATDIQSILRQHLDDAGLLYFSESNESEGGSEEADRNCSQEIRHQGIIKGDGLIAQWLEQQTHNLLVPGSNPGGPTNIRGPFHFCDFEAAASRLART
jgi:hypothetical protein